MVRPDKTAGIRGLDGMVSFAGMSGRHGGSTAIAALITLVTLVTLAASATDGRRGRLVGMRRRSDETAAAGGRGGLEGLASIRGRHNSSVTSLVMAPGIDDTTPLAALVTLIASAEGLERRFVLLATTAGNTLPAVIAILSAKATNTVLPTAAISILTAQNAALTATAILPAKATNTVLSTATISILTAQNAALTATAILPAKATNTVLSTATIESWLNSTRRRPNYGRCRLGDIDDRLDDWSGCLDGISRDDRGCRESRRRTD